MQTFSSVDEPGMFQGARVTQCAYCRRKLPGQFCEAFPGGIPQPIIYNEADHRLPYPGDYGMQLILRSGIDPATIDRLFEGEA